jgi:hypothetical protein
MTLHDTTRHGTARHDNKMRVSLRTHQSRPKKKKKKGKEKEKQEGWAGMPCAWT